MNTVAQHPFDTPVKAGEVRIFGERKSPLVALVTEDCGLRGYRIVPVASRVRPASRREMLVGARVYQLWNAVVAPRGFVEKSWTVETLSAEDFMEIAKSVDAALPGKITDGDSDQARYERENLLNVDRLVGELNGDAQDAEEIQMLPVDAISSPRRKHHFFAYSAWSMAAMLTVCAGVTWLTLREEPAACDAERRSRGDRPTDAPVKVVEPVKAVKPVEQVKSVEAVKTAKAAPVKVVEPVKAVKPVEQVKSVEVKTAKAAEPIKAVEPAPAPVVVDAAPSPRKPSVETVGPAPRASHNIAERRSWGDRPTDAPVKVGPAPCARHNIAERRSRGDRPTDVPVEAAEVFEQTKSFERAEVEVSRSMERSAAKSMPSGERCKKVDYARCVSLPDSVACKVRSFDSAPELNVARFANRGENPFADPRVEPLSTFGLDVDTSSYTMMRRYIEEFGRLPPAESVRIEEYVNYFKFDYPEPTDETPIAIAAECGECPWNKAHKLLRLGLKAKDLAKLAAQKGSKLPPCNLTFLIDVSGSMFGPGRLGLAKQGLKMLVEQMREEDHVAIVTYACGTDVRLPATSGANKSQIRSVIDSLSAGGGTAGGAGIELAYAEAQKNFDKKANNRVILVTDGDFNVGVSGPDGLERLIEEKRESGIFLSVFGVGHGNFRDRAMKKLADAGNGTYAYMDSALEAKKVFCDAFAGTLYTVAKDVKLQVEFNPAEVAKYRLLGYENRALAARDFNDDKKDAGEMGSGHTMTAFYEIIPFGVDESGVDPLKYQKNAEKPTRPAGASDELCTVKLRWKAPDGDVSARCDLPLTASAITPKTPTEDFRFASAVAEFALLLKNSAYKGTANFESLLKCARQAKGKDDEGYRAEFIRLVERAQLSARPNENLNTRPRADLRRPNRAVGIDDDL